MLEIIMSIDKFISNSLPLLIIFIMIITIIKGPVSKFLTRNFLDSGKDRYGENSKNTNPTVKIKNNPQQITEENIRLQVRHVLLNESSESHFNQYKKNIEKLIEEKQEKLINDAILEASSEKNIEHEITKSLTKTVEYTTTRLIRDNEEYKKLEQEAVAKLDLIKISSFLEHLEKEYDASRSTKALMSNMFILVNIVYFFGLLAFLIIGKGIDTSPSIYLALSLSYIGLGSFVVYMIKFCNARSLTLLSLREGFLKREQISQMTKKIIETGANEHHVAILQLINSSTATKEQKINHPYEMLLYGIKDSNIMFKGGKFEIKKESSIKPNP